ncbi:50S ribosomal protein L4, partial [Staphylococcus epidermidis]|uniref:50S ribosomal protein L4 n=1 Tax=Staphylococcus epidermidis TaxID=1282 RepID=UPI0011A68448
RRRLLFRPTPTTYPYKIPNKIPPLPLPSPLSFKLQQNTFTVVDTFPFQPPKTKQCKNLLTTLQQPKKVLLLTQNEDLNLELSPPNIPGVQV